MKALSEPAGLFQILLNKNLKIVVCQEHYTLCKFAPRGEIFAHCWVMAGVQIFMQNKTTIEFSKKNAMGDIFYLSVQMWR